MSDKALLKCAKCGTTSKEDPSLTFHRFPLPSKRYGSLKAKVWAKFCFPDDDFTSETSLLRLHAQHKMICGKHFDDSSYTHSNRKRLTKFAIPISSQEIMAELRKEQSVTPQIAQASSTNEPAAELMDIQVTASTMQFSNIVAQNTQFQVQTEENIEQMASTSKPITVKQSRKGKGILKEIDVASCKDMTPKKQKLYKKCRKNLSEIIRLRLKLKKIKKCRRNIISTLASNDAVNDIIKSKLSSSFYLLLQSQLKNTARKLTGRRWSLDDKVLALGIYKKSSSCYRLLRRLFALPSVSSLKALLNKIPLRCGINAQVIDTVKEIARSRNIEDNLCVVAFDEMSIRKNLYYNCKQDEIDGYQDHAVQGKSSEIATHALTFMAIGVRKQWKQPMAFYFSGSHVTADRLAVLMKEVLSACFSAGLIVIGTVCDLDGANIRALNILGSSTEQPYFYHEGHEIVTILDPPHLLKCFRNNFIKHDIEFTEEMQIDGQQNQGVARWTHIKELYDLDKQNPNFVYAPALTESHLNPNGKQKMKVCLAAQVLSHSVAAGLFANAAQNRLPQAAIGTATVVANMDKLFDAMNGDTPYPKRGKEYLKNMSASSPHLELFKKMKKFFKEMKFIGAKCKPPSQEGWVRTLNAIERICYNLKKIYEIKTFSVKRLNQDPLENCFGCIRNNCGCNPNPTSGQFVAALKTSLITNLINNNKNRNCLDDNDDLLNNFKDFLSQDSTEKKPQAINISTGTDEDIDAINLYGINEIDDEEENLMLQCSGELQACTYVCGFIVKHINLNCDNCKSAMLVEQNTEAFHLFTSFREYDEDKCRLKYVQRNFTYMVEGAATRINNYLKTNSHKPEIKKHLKTLCENINIDWLKQGCEEHYECNKQIIINSTILICLKRFCIVKNREFVEEASKKSLRKKINILKHV